MWNIKIPIKTLSIKGKRSWLLGMCAFLVALIILIFHVYHYLPFIADDALISLRYAQRLLAGKGLTWTDGQPVEGYSNLLWILLVSLPGAFGVDLIASARILGIIGMAAALLAMVRSQDDSQSIYRKLPATAIALLFFSLAVPVAVWAIGGLEQPVIAGLLAWVFTLYFHLIRSEPPRNSTISLLSLCLGLLCLTRPDGPIFTITIIIALLMSKRTGQQVFSLVMKLLRFPVLLYGGQLLFRFLYYGEWVPNTSLVKLTPSTHHVYNGLMYLLNGLNALSPLSYLAIVMLVYLLITKETRPTALVLGITAGVWMLYIVFIGGDIFPAWRHVIPIVVVFAFALAEGSAFCWNRFRHKYVKTIFIIVLIAAFPSFVLLQFQNPENRRAREERWEWDGKVIGLFLKAAFGHQQPLFAITASGCLPYWSELPALDMLGLNDYYLPRHPPDNLGQGYLGHELGDGQYILSRRPDLISFCGPGGSLHACFLGEKQLLETQKFFEAYTPVKFMGTSPHQFTSIIWVRKYSEKIGIQETRKEIVIPAFLFNENPETVAYLNAQNECVIAVAHGRYAATILPQVPAGQWQVFINAPEAAKFNFAIQRAATGAIRIVLTTNETEEVEIKEVILRSNDAERR
jgi:arabinofuranosyltransferase